MLRKNIHSANSEKIYIIYIYKVVVIFHSNDNVVMLKVF